MHASPSLGLALAATLLAAAAMPARADDLDHRIVRLDGRYYFVLNGVRHPLVVAAVDEEVARALPEGDPLATFDVVAPSPASSPPLAQAAEADGATDDPPDGADLTAAEQQAAPRFASALRASLQCVQRFNRILASPPQSALELLATRREVAEAGSCMAEAERDVRALDAPSGRMRRTRDGVASILQRLQRITSRIVQAIDTLDTDALDLAQGDIRALREEVRDLAADLQRRFPADFLDVSWDASPATAATPAPEASGEWVTIKRWAARGTVTTEQFELHGRPARVSYRSEATALFMVYLYKAGERAGSDFPAAVPVMLMAPATETSYIHVPAGSYYFFIGAVGGEWELALEEQR